MSLSKGERTTMAGGIALLATGTGIGARGAVTSDVPQSLAGTCLVITALTTIVLTLAHHWVTDTRAERQELARSIGEAEAERRRFVALRGALEAESARSVSDLNEQRTKLAAQLFTERETMRKEFEDRRLQVAGDAFRIGAQMERAGMLKSDDPVPSNLIRLFPEQAPQPERERSRGHGVVGP
ncbi:hypothetical protein [Streptomyces sp. NPDC088789]|uniref:hypothetical protein n=1 Tax=Streptomyces sp. NPDC088789 TaxID=3365899 RepID=UPI00380F61DA